MDINTTSATVIPPWSNTQILVVVPDVPVGVYDVTVTTSTGQSNPVPFQVKIKPVINSLSPGYGSIDTAVTIIGQNFGTTQGTGTVVFGGTSADVISWSDEAIEVIVPSIPTVPFNIPALPNDSPPLSPVTVTTTEGTSNALRFDPRTTQDFLRQAVAEARAALRAQQNTNPTPVELSREAFREAIGLREWCKDQSTGAFPLPEGDVCVKNSYARDAEYFLRGYEGGALLLSPVEIQITNPLQLRDEVGNLFGPLSTGVRNLLKAIVLLFNDHISDLGGLTANAEGYYHGFVGTPLDTAVEQYGTPLVLQLLRDSLPNSPIVPKGSITIPIADIASTATINSFAGAVNANKSYFFDPPGADSYVLGVAGGNSIRSVIVPSDLGFTAQKYVIGVGDQSFNVNVGEVFDFSQHGFADGVDGFEIRDFDVPLNRELVTGLVFTQSGNTLLIEVLLRSTPTQPQPPVAHAGPDQSVNEGDLVTLDGSGSTDPQGLPLQFTWSQVSGPPVTLNLSDPVHPTFLAPTVPASGATLSFQLIVSDGPLTGTATVNITVKDVNHPPVALAGPDQAVAEASLVTLDGSASYDPDADALTYFWSQTGGPSVTLTNSNVAKPMFLAPLVGPSETTLSFELTVTDTSGSNASVTTKVNVTNVNHPPIANAGLDQTRNAGAMIQLDGTASSDPDGDLLTFTWSQLSGSVVTLSDIHSATPTFVGPQVLSSTTLTFQLVVDDGFGGTASADVHITLLPIDAAPFCTHARAHPALLWPPDHKLEKVTIKGVTDPDDQKVKLTVTHVTQDEPQGCTARRRSRDYDRDDDEAHGCRHTTPDAIMHRHGHVLLRAERRGHGNGRVYQITFQATDGRGGQCTGQVRVCVPHDRHDRTCVDDGQKYNSTQ